MASGYISFDYMFIFMWTSEMTIDSSS